MIHQEEQDYHSTYIALIPRGGESLRRLTKLMLLLGEQATTPVHPLMMDGGQRIHHQHPRNKKLSTKKNLQTIATWNLRQRKH